jgi:hypothetical protein
MSRDADIEAILARRHQQGGDYWATLDGRIYVGNPFSTLSSLGLLHELGVGPDHEAVEGGLGLVLDRCRGDGRVQVAPKAPLYPCYTAEAARILCRFGRKDDAVVERIFAYFEESAHPEGGWRCSFSRFGKGPETECANPGATLYVLDALRHLRRYRQGSAVADRAVEHLLGHWETRKPLGPCHWGIGSRFLEVEYPFVRYNLFFYVYVLSFFARAQADPRFREAHGRLAEKLDSQGRMVVESPHRGLGGLAFCAKGRASSAASGRYREILERLGEPERGGSP